MACPDPNATQLLKANSSVPSKSPLMRFFCFRFSTENLAVGCATALICSWIRERSVFKH